MNKIALLILSCLSILPAVNAEHKTFRWATDLNYRFLPKQKMEFQNGIIRNPGRSADPDADAQYSRKVKVDRLTFTLPGELCETLSACYKADLNNDNVPDYVFVNIKVWNGRFAGQSDVGIFVSNQQKKYTFNAFETRHLEAEVTNGKIMLIKYVFSDDDENLIRQFYTFKANGRIFLHKAEKFVCKY